MIRNITVGIPKGLLFYRYEHLWVSFFEKLGISVLLSEPTTQRLADRGASLTIDEACLALKIYFGHVASLIGKCDYILIPRVSNFGNLRGMCTRFESLYDTTKNVFRNTPQKFIPFNVDVRNNVYEQDAFISLGNSLGLPSEVCEKAYLSAKSDVDKKWSDAVQVQEALYKKDGLKIMIAAHDYVIKDPHIGEPISKFLSKNGAIPIYAHIVDREAALRRSVELSPTCKWELNREIVGNIVINKDRVDGIILLSAFPCGPDAMVNELMLRKVSGIPIFNLVLDGQSGLAGIETRLESFLDIIRFKRGS